MSTCQFAICACSIGGAPRRSSLPCRREPSCWPVLRARVVSLALTMFAIKWCFLGTHRWLFCRSWDALRTCTRCSSLAVISRQQCLLLAGAVMPGSEPWRHAQLGSIGSRALSEGRGNYLANLALYPGGQTMPMTNPCNAQASAACMCAI